MSISKAQHVKNDALMNAIGRDDAKGVRIALTNGADPNAIWRPNGVANVYGYRALHLAVSRECVNVVKELLTTESFV